MKSIDIKEDIIPDLQSLVELYRLVSEIRPYCDFRYSVRSPTIS
jgi:hypothetical protein